MTPKAKEKEIIDPLENLAKLFQVIVEFILINSQIIIVILGIGFLIIILLLMNFFNLFGF